MLTVHLCEWWWPLKFLGGSCTWFHHLCVKLGCAYAYTKTIVTFSVCRTVWHGTELTLTQILNINFDHFFVLIGAWFFDSMCRVCHSQGGENVLVGVRKSIHSRKISIVEQEVGCPSTGVLSQLRKYGKVRYNRGRTTLNYKSPSHVDGWMGKAKDSQNVRTNLYLIMPFS